jgi:hypothetical protein
MNQQTAMEMQPNEEAAARLLPMIGCEKYGVGRMSLAVDEIVGRAQAILQRSQIRALRRLTATDDGDAIGLYGRVDTFYHKQLAQELVRNEVEDVPIVNHVRVAGG